MPVHHSTPVAAHRTSAASFHPLRAGDHGPTVKQLQARLNVLGLDAGPVDGAYGPMTTDAVKRFQHAKQLPVTGIADVATQTRLRASIVHQHAIEKRKRVELFSAPVRAVNKRLDDVGRKVDRFTADGVVTRTEKRSLRKSISAARSTAEALPSHEANPTLNLLSRLQLVTKNGKLTAKAEVYEQKLKAQRASLLKQAQHDATHNPLNRPGFTTRYHGVATRDFTYKGLKVHAVAIDLADPRVRLQTNSESTRGRTVESQAQAHHAEVAINGDFFTYSNHRPSGLAITRGEQWTGTSSGFEPSIAFTGRHAQVLNSGHHGEPDWANNVVSARPQVLKNGRLVSPGDQNEVSSRTGLGLSKNGRTMFMVAVEGQSGVRGLSAVQVGELLRKLGADDAIAMDGGGSAQMYQRGRGVVHRSTDGGAGRPVSNVVMVQSR